ncbi:RNA polymerase sigma factor RpoD [Striga asiatica]|uniref:RNA polymerase sigma factor RpoD n=1 Tax=Striga asiatica TaxID=4170 RepID=A0A5A7R5N8_STRAF|nr:RNA polymerase sigma factor RpoD [Striga asiatica]
MNPRDIIISQPLISINTISKGHRFRPSHSSDSQSKESIPKRKSRKAFPRLAAPSAKDKRQLSHVRNPIRENSRDHSSRYAELVLDSQKPRQENVYRKRKGRQITDDHVLALCLQIHLAAEGHDKRVDNGYEPQPDSSRHVSNRLVLSESF